MDALDGKVGMVVSSSRGELHEGAVKVFGSTWTAYPVDGEEPLEAGDRVQVEKVQGASIYVRRIGQVGQGGDWRGKELNEKTGEVKINPLEGSRETDVFFGRV